MGAKKHRTEYEDFELDLTPLLAIIMKLVPVLILSSSFLDLTQIDTDLPQVVKENLDVQKQKPSEFPRISLALLNSRDISVFVDNQQISHIHSESGLFNLKKLNDELIQLKKKNPEVFQIEFAPQDDLPQQEIISVMDSVRKPANEELFVFKNRISGKEYTTNLLYPEVEFVNIFE